MPSLDGLRGLAVALVVLSHLNLSRMPVIPGLDFAGGGFYGVCLFFTLSAYLLTALLLKHNLEDLRSVTVWRQYFLRRFLRIYPLYTAVLLATYFAFTGGADFADPMSFRSVIDHLMLRAGVGVFWTIPVECLFYLLLPIIILAGTAVPQRPYALAIAGALLVAMVIGGNTLFPSDSRMALWKNLPAFLGGVYVAWSSRWLHHRLGRPGSNARTMVEVSGWLALIAVVIHFPSVWNVVFGDDIPVGRFHDDPGRFGALWAVFLIAVIHGRGTLRRRLCAKPLRYLGTISFSVYLVHLPVLRAISAWMPESPNLAAWTSIAATLVLSVATYLTIEKPFIDLGRARRGSTPDPELAVTA